MHLQPTSDCPHPDLIIINFTNGRTIFLKGDAGAPYGDVVTVLAMLRETGLQNVSLVAEPLSAQ